MLLELLPPKAERTIETLGLTREDAARILGVFFRIDKDASNEVSLVEFLSYEYRTLPLMTRASP